MDGIMTTGDIPGETTPIPSRHVEPTAWLSILEHVTSHDDLTADMIFTFFRRHPVAEHIVLKELRYLDEAPYRIVFRFDRSFKSTMYTPDHLTFLSILPVFQKIYYYFLLERFHRRDETSKEGFKIWPVSLDIRIPKLITKTNGLKGEIVEHTFKRLGARGDSLYENAVRYMLDTSLVVEDSMSVDVKSLVYDLSG